MRQPAQNAAHLRPALASDHRVLGTRGRTPDLHQQLPPVTAPLSAQRVERRVHGGNPHPSRRLLVIAAEAAVGGQEHVLGDVLGALCVTDHAVGQAHDGLVMVTKEGLEVRRRRADVRALPLAVLSGRQSDHTP